MSTAARLVFLRTQTELCSVERSSTRWLSAGSAASAPVTAIAPSSAPGISQPRRRGAARNARAAATTDDSQIERVSVSRRPTAHSAITAQHA